MELKEILTGIVVPLVAGFIGGSIGTIIINKNINKTKETRKMKNENIDVTGDVFNGDKMDK